MSARSQKIKKKELQANQAAKRIKAKVQHLYKIFLLNPKKEKEMIMQTNQMHLFKFEF